MSQLTFVSCHLVQFSVFRYDTWVDLKHFATAPDASDHALLVALLKHDQYHDHYAGEDPSEQTHHALHGPYRLDAITRETFEPVSQTMAQQEIMDWVASWVVQDEDGPQVEAMVTSDVLPWLSAGSLFRLPDVRATAEHDWGWVVGATGFHELVAIDRSSSALTVLVASDD